MIHDIAVDVLEFVEPAVRDTELGALLRPDRIVVRTIPPAGVQALTIWIAPRHAIALNRGLALFLYRLARAFSAHVIVRTENDAPAPPESRTVDIIATVLDWMSSVVAAPMVEDWPTGPRELRTAENYTTAAERFVLSHEIGHIFHRHLIVDGADVDARRTSPADLDDRPVEQEIEADITGAVLTIESLERSGVDPRAGVVGMQFFFKALALAERVGAALVDATHLPAEHRLALCYATLPRRYGPRWDVLRAATAELDDVLDRLSSAALDERDRRRTEAVEHMRAFFGSTPWSWGHRDPVADRALLEEVHAVMRRAPSAVLDALRTNLLDGPEYTRRMKAATSPAELERDDVLRRHNLAHFVARNSPVHVRTALGVIGIGE